MKLMAACSMNNRVVPLGGPNERLADLSNGHFRIHVLYLEYMRRNPLVKILAAKCQCGLVSLAFVTITRTCWKCHTVPTQYQICNLDEFANRYREAVIEPILNGGGYIQQRLIDNVNMSAYYLAVVPVNNSQEPFRLDDQLLWRPSGQRQPQPNMGHVVPWFNMVKNNLFFLPVFMNDDNICY